jgi:hypothetical protein
MKRGSTSISSIKKGSSDIEKVYRGNVLVYSSMDSDAAAYLSAVQSAGGTISPTISSATNVLFTELKRLNLYSKVPYFYPIVGGTASSHAIMGNRSFGTTYDLTYYGTNISHSSNGITKTLPSGDPSTQDHWCDTKVVPSTLLSLNSFHMSVYQSVYQDDPFGYHGAGVPVYIALRVPYQNYIAGYASVDISNPPNAYRGDGRIYSIMTRTSSSTVKAFDRVVSESTLTQYGTTQTSPQESLPENSIAIFKINPNGFGGNGTIAFFTIGEGLSDTECGDLDKIISDFNTSLGRNF